LAKVWSVPRVNRRGFLPLTARGPKVKCDQNSGV
jgi:hypothetical protein